MVNARGRNKERTISTKAEEVPTVRRQLPSIPEPPELRSLVISGSLSDALSVVTRTMASLHLVIGKTDDEDVEALEKFLVPLAQFRLGGGGIADVQNVDDAAESPMLLSATVSLENMAFMVVDLMTDLHRICVEVSSLAGGELAVDPVRMAHVRYYVAHLERQARMCRVRLDRVYGEPQARAVD